MFRQKTVFIIGAGVSTDYGFPIGVGLAELIHQKSDIRFKSYQPNGEGDFDLYDNVKVLHTPHEEVRRAFIRIRDGILQTNSIDDFLDLHQADALMRMAGKCTIVNAILEKERNCSLMPPEDSSRFPVLPIKNTWAWKLVRMLGSGASKNTVFDNVTFISFNYDRCLEQVLWQGIRDLYSIPQEEMPEIMKPLAIFHPYGSIGPLPVSGLPGQVPFGGSGYDDCLKLADNIYTYTEQVRDKKDAAGLETALIRAEQLVFLGFGFHKQNMALLKIKGDMGAKKVFGTLFNVYPPNADIMKQRVLELFQENVRAVERQHNFNFVAQSAAELLDYYSLVLTA